MNRVTKLLLAALFCIILAFAIPLTARTYLLQRNELQTAKKTKVSLEAQKTELENRILETESRLKRLGQGTVASTSSTTGPSQTNEIVEVVGGYSGESSTASGQPGAPIDATTLDGMHNFGFTLAYVSGNGALTSTHLFLTGGVTAGASEFGGPLTIDVPVGEAPFVISSTTVVTNLNADYLDGVHSGSLLSLTGGTMTGNIAWNGTQTFGNATITDLNTLVGGGVTTLHTHPGGGTSLWTDNATYIYPTNIGTTFQILDTGDLTVPGTVTAAAFSGSGAGLTGVNADTVDTRHAADFLLLGGGTMTGNIAWNGTQTFGNATIANMNELVGGGSTSLHTHPGIGLWADSGTYLYPTNIGTTFQITDAGDLTVPGTVTAAAFSGSFSGSGSGLTGVNADTLDTYHASSFLLLSGGTMTGNIAWNGTQTFGNATVSNLNELVGGGSTTLHTHSGLGLWADSGTYLYPTNIGTTFQILDTGDLTVPGTVTAAAFSGSGAGLTGVNADTVDTRHAADFLLLGGGTMTGNIAWNGTQTFGNATIANMNELVGGGSTSLHTHPGIGLWADSGTYLYPTNIGTTFQITDAGDLTVPGTITAAAFSGSGAGLTDITAANATNAAQLNGQSASYYLDTSGTGQTKTGSLTAGGLSSTTGISAANNINTTGGGIQTGGTTRIDNTGNLTNIGNISGSSAITITPQAGQNLNIALSGAGDLAVNTNQLYADTSSGNVGIGTAAPTDKLDVAGAILADYGLGLDQTVWQELTQVPSLAVTWGGAQVSGPGNYIYSFPGTSATFMRYNVATREYTAIAPAPAAVVDGASLTYTGGDYIYATQGAGYDTFWRYSISANTWTTMPVLPAGLGSGAAICYPGSGDFIFATQGGMSGAFWAYSISNNDWNTTLDPPDTSWIITGGSLAAANGYIFATEGGSTGSMMAYSILNNDWTTLDPTDCPVGLGAGASMVYPGSGDYVYLLEASSTAVFMAYSLTNNDWTTFDPTDAPAPAYWGASLVAKSGYLFAFAGWDTSTYMRYATIGDTWNTLMSGTGAIGYGGAMASTGGDNIYAFTGENTGGFVRYSASSGSWLSLTSPPGNVYDGGSLMYPGSGDYIYAFLGGGTTSFLSYSISGDTWSGLTSAPGAVNDGAALCYPGSGDYIYALEGAGAASFWAYSITNNNWTTFDPTDAPGGVSSGGSLVYPGSGDYIYALQGYGGTAFWAYSLTDNNWTTFDPADPSVAVYMGGCLVYPGSGSYIYAFAGWGQNSFMRYSTISNTWTQLVGAPAGVNQGGSLTYPGAGDYLYGFRGGDTRNVWRVNYVNSEYKGSGLRAAATGRMDFAVSGVGEMQLASGGQLKLVGTSAGITLGDDVNLFRGTNNRLDLASGDSMNLVNGSYQVAGTTVIDANRIIYAADGSATGSSHTFLSDTNTGMYRIAEDTLGFSTSGAERMRIDTSGAMEVAGATVTGNLQLGSATANWQSLLTLPGTVTNGGAMTPGDGNYIYSFRGTSAQFWRCDVTTNTWKQMASTPANVTTGASLVYPGSGDYIYATQGGTTVFWRYSISGNSWITRTAPTTTFTAGARLCYPDSGDYIYATHGGNRTTFSAYSISNNNWNTTLDPVDSPVTIGDGAGLCYPGSGNYIYATRGGGYTNFRAYSLVTGLWSTYVPPVVPATIGTGGGLAYPGSGNYVYATCGAGSTSFYAFSLVTSLWTTFDPTDAPAAINYGGCLAGKGGNIYGYRGTVTGDYLQYSVAGNSWSTLMSGSGIFGYGAQLESVGSDDIYAFAGGTTTGFYKYSVSQGAWTGLAATPAAVADGGALVYPGSGDYLYALQGNTQTAFWRYSISGNSWSSMSSTPASVGAGGSLAYPGSGDYIYAFRGGNSTTFWAYSISGNSWVAYDPTDVVNGVSSGGDLVYPGSGDYIYAFRGAGYPTFWRYSVSGNSWSAMASSPTVNNGGAALAACGRSDRLYALHGGGLYGFSTYTPSSNTWGGQTPPPSIVNNGGSLTYSPGGNYLYAVAGGNTNSFWRFSLSGLYSLSGGAAEIRGRTEMAGVEANSLFASTQSGTGNIATYANTTSATADAFKISNLGTGRSLVVEDQVSDTTPFVIDASGNVGVGTGTPSQKVAVSDGTNELFLVRTTNGATGWRAANATMYVGMDATTNRSINAAGSINASGADYAEWFPSKAVSLTAGDVVAIDNENPGYVKQVSSSRSTQALGVVSTKPGFTGNDGASIENAKIIALMGQVPVRVCDENGAIGIGDFLTSSSQAATVMKANFGDPAIGQALESFTKQGSGVITAYISRGVAFANPSALLPENQIPTFGSLTTMQKDILAKLELTSSGGIVVRADLDVRGRLKLSGDNRGYDVPCSEGITEIVVEFTKPRDTGKYAISITPSWLTPVAIVEKKSTGFKVRLKDPAPADATIDWIVID